MNRSISLALICLSGLVFSQTNLTHLLAERPNVIVIMTDDQGYGDMSCHGNPVLKTPAMDALHRESLRFTNFHVDPTCSPTRAALMTGRYSTRTGVWLTYMSCHHLRSDETTMADVFQQNGYATAIFGKWHLGDNYPYRPNDRGFEESLIHGGGVVGEAPDFWGNDYYDDTYFRNGEPEKVDGYCTDVWFKEAFKFAKKCASKNKPFFIYVPCNAPHGPFNVPIKYAQPYHDAKVPHSRAQFYGCIASIDENIGRLRKQLSESGLTENTLLIFLTDNGTATGYSGGRSGWPKSGFNAGMRGRKGTAYDGGHRAACFMHWPAGIEGGRDVPQLSAHLDLLPTLCDLCDLSFMDLEPDGKSLLPLIESPETEWPDRTLFVHHQGRFGQTIKHDRPIKYKHYAAMTERWRLVGNDGKLELFDINADPSQKTDIKKQHPGVVRELSDAYEVWWADVTSRSNEYNRMIIGSPKQPVTLLTCQQWHSPISPYNQYHVRSGVETNGFLDLEVATAGKYQIELRRWPREVNEPFNAIDPPRELDPNFVDAKNKNANLPSKKFFFSRAKLKIGDIVLNQEVIAHEAVGVTFNIELQPGPVDLQTWLFKPDDTSIGAYYVYVTKTGELAPDSAK